MKRQTKKGIVGMIALTLLFSTVGPSVTRLVQANDIQVSQQQSKIGIRLNGLPLTNLTWLFYNKKKKN
nr:hypothetical protein [Lactococcus formosensis]